MVMTMMSWVARVAGRTSTGGDIVDHLVMIMTVVMVSIMAVVMVMIMAVVVVLMMAVKMVIMLMARIVKIVMMVRKY